MNVIEHRAEGLTSTLAGVHNLLATEFRNERNACRIWRHSQPFAHRAPNAFTFGRREMLDKRLLFTSLAHKVGNSFFSHVRVPNSS